MRRRGNHLVVCQTEHRAVLEAADAAEADGFEVDRIPVTPDGLVTPDVLSLHLRSDTVLCSVMLANNETGVMHPIPELAAICEAQGTLFHTDAAQAVGQLPINVDALGVDLLSASAHKMYGPKGVGALYIRGGRRAGLVAPIQVGGGQEFGLRGGTTPVPLVVGFGQAAVETESWLRSGGHDLLTFLRESLWHQLRDAVPGVRRVSPLGGLPSTLMVEVSGIDAPALVAQVAGVVACSSGSACNSGAPGPSHVLRAMGHYPNGALRFGLGRATKKDQLVAAVSAIKAAVDRIRRLEPVHAP